MFLVTNLVNSHLRCSSGRQTPEHQIRQVHRGILVVVKAVLQKQRIEVGAYDQIDCRRGLVQGSLAFEVTGLPAFLQDIAKQLLDALFVGHHRLPAFRGSGGGNLVKLAILEKQAKARFSQGFEHFPQLFWRHIAPGNSSADFGFDLAQAVRADHLANGLLGLKELVDVGLGKPNGFGEIRDGRFLVTVAAEVLRGCGDDLATYLVIGRASGWNRLVACLFHGASLRQSLKLDKW